jgi:hypothetical protein
MREGFPHQQLENQELFFEDDFLEVERFEDDFFDVDFFEELFLVAPFFEPEDFFEDFPDDDFFEEAFFEEDFFDGTFPPARRASERPMAMACFRLFTVLPLDPDLSVPFFRSCIAFSTFSCAFSPYLAMIFSFPRS